jgi:hypothetical protein
MWKKKFKKSRGIIYENRGYPNILLEIGGIWILFSKSRGYLKISLKKTTTHKRTKEKGSRKRKRARPPAKPNERMHTKCPEARML